MEEWRPVVGYEGRYIVSSNGRVASTLRPGSGPRELAWLLDQRKYPYVHLYKNDKRRHGRIHMLVAEAFIGPRPEGQLVRHLDGDPFNPTVGNLMYGTPSENERDKLLHGTRRPRVRKEASPRPAGPKTHCINGHAYTPENSYILGSYRRCRTCVKLRNYGRPKV